MPTPQGSSNERTKLVAFSGNPGPNYVTGPANEAAGGTKFDLTAMQEALEFLANPDVCVPIMTAMSDVIRNRPRRGR